MGFLSKFGRGDVGFEKGPSLAHRWAHVRNAPLFMVEVGSTDYWVEQNIVGT